MLTDRLQPPTTSFLDKDILEGCHRPIVLKGDRGMDRPKDCKVIAIVGCSRSGSTALEQHLVGSLGAIGVGELRHVWGRGILDQEKCSCGAPVQECAFWKTVLTEQFEGRERGAAEKIERARRYWESPRGFLGRMLPIFRTRFWRVNKDVLLRAIGSMHEAARTHAGGRVIIDSSKRPSHWALLTEIYGNQLKTIHIVRDPRAVSYSWGKIKKRPEAATKDQFMARRGVVFSCLAWWAYNAYFSIFLRSPRIQTIRYEDLCRAPKSVLKTLPPSRADSLGWFHSVSGNPARMSGEQFRLRLDNAWKKKMGPPKVILVNLLTFPLLWLYRYPWARGAD